MSRKTTLRMTWALWSVLPLLSALAGIVANAAMPTANTRHTPRALPAHATPTSVGQTPVTAAVTASNTLLKVPPASDFGFLQAHASTPHALATKVSSNLPDVILDNTLGQFQSVTGPHYTLAQSQGILKGSNLFYSFSRFGLVGGETVSFAGPPSVQNVLARVTGGQPSNIDGTISCTIPNANLFLINPAGIVFGRDAVLDVKGSFAVSTADLVRLGGGGSFSASSPSASILTSAPPSGFGFLSASPAALNVNGSNLGVPAGSLVAISAGSVAIVGGSLSAPGGRVAIASVGSSGTVNFDPSNSVAALQTSSFSKLGGVTIANGAVVSTDGVNGAGGRIEVQSDSLTLTDSLLSAATTGLGHGRGINLNLRGSFTATNTSIASDTNSSGDAGDLQLSAGSLALNGGTLETNTSGTGVGGNVTVNVVGDAVVNGMRHVNAGITALAMSDGAAGGVTIQTGSLTVRAGATINASTYGTGNGGTINVTVANALILDGAGARQPANNVAESTGIGSASYLQTAPGGGAAGKINVSAASLSLFNGAQIDGSTFSTGNGGDLNINVSGSVILDGTRQHVGEEFTSISAENFGPIGAGGNVTVNAGSLTIRKANINALTSNTGTGGSVTVHVTGQTSLDGLGLFILPVLSTSDPAASNPGFATGIFAGSTPLIPAGGGAGGNVSVRSGSLLMQNGAIIDTSTLGPGNAGKVTVVTGNLVIRNGGGVASFTEGTGHGGDVNVTVSTTAVLDGSSTPTSLNDLFGGLTGIGADSFGSGGGGQVHVKTGGNLTLIGSGQISSLSTGQGPAGNVTVMAGGIMKLSGGSSSVQAAHAKGGDLTLDVQGGIELFDNSTLSAGAAANGGNIHLKSPRNVVVQGSTITAAAVGNGGNLTIDPALVVLQNSKLFANAVNGNGGKITITAGLFLKSNTPITASGGPFGVAGTILVSSPDTSIARSLAAFRADLAIHELVLVPACGQMVGNNVSSFLPIGNSGMAAEPGGLLPSFDPAGAGK